MTSERSELEALACEIYNAHRTERIMAGKKNVASWWGMDARHREHWMKVARRLQPARVPAYRDRVSEIEDAVAAGTMNAYQCFTQMRQLVVAAAPAAEGGKAWESPFGSCVCEGQNQCPGCNPNEAIKMAAEIATADERAKHPPCMECGAKTAKEAETMCHCSGDKDDCHGCQLWPDVEATPAPESREAPKCADCGAPNGELCRRRIGNDGERGIFYMCSRLYDTPEAGQREALKTPLAQSLQSIRDSSPKTDRVPAEQIIGQREGVEAMEDWLGAPDAWYEAGPCHIGFISTDKTAVENYISKRNAELDPRSTNLMRQGPYPLYGYDRCHDLIVELISARRLASAQQAGPLYGKYGDVLRPFVRMMEGELQANAGKGDRPGWLAMSPDTCLLEIFYHLAKLQKAVRDDNGPGIMEYGADVANMSMMLVDICGGLAEPEQRTGSRGEGGDVAFERTARKLYTEWTDNQDIHCNRFPSWEELDEKARVKWRKKAAQAEGEA